METVRKYRAITSVAHANAELRAWAVQFYKILRRVDKWCNTADAKELDDRKISSLRSRISEHNTYMNRLKKDSARVQEAIDRAVSEGRVGKSFEETAAQEIYDIKKFGPYRVWDYIRKIRKLQFNTNDVPALRLLFKTIKQVDKIITLAKTVNRKLGKLERNAGYSNGKRLIRLR